MSAYAALVVDINANISGLRKETGEATKVIKEADEKFTAFGKTVKNLGFAFLGFNSLVGALRTTRELVDEWTRMGVLLRNVSAGFESAAYAQRRLFDVAQATRQNVGEVVRNFSSFQRNAAQIGVSPEQAIALQKTISQAVALSGARADSAASALVQFGQGIASGVLRGEELNAVLEQTPKLAKAIADGMDVPLGKLLQMGRAGELTAEKIIAALTKMGPALEREFQDVIPTIADSFTQLTNSAGNFINKFSEATGIAEALARALRSVSETMDKWAAGIKPSLAEGMKGELDRLDAQIAEAKGRLRPTGDELQGPVRFLPRIPFSQMPEDQSIAGWAFQRRVPDISTGAPQAPMNGSYESFLAANAAGLSAAQWLLNKVPASKPWASLRGNEPIPKSTDAALPILTEGGIAEAERRRSIMAAKLQEMGFNPETGGPAANLARLDQEIADRWERFKEEGLDIAAKLDWSARNISNDARNAINNLLKARESGAYGDPYSKEGTARFERAAKEVLDQLGFYKKAKEKAEKPDLMRELIDKAVMQDIERLDKMREKFIDMLDPVAKYKNELEDLADLEKATLEAANTRLRRVGGTPFDTTRPRLRNADGSVSTEETITIEDKAKGKFVNLPTIVDGLRRTTDEAEQLYREGRNAAVGQFSTLQEAVSAAQARTDLLGELLANLDQIQNVRNEILANSDKAMEKVKRERKLAEEPLTPAREQLDGYLEQLRIENDLLNMTGVQREARVKLLDAEKLNLERGTAEWERYRVALESAIGAQKLAAVDRKIKGGDQADQTELLQLVVQDLEDTLSDPGNTPEQILAAQTKAAARFTTILGLMRKPAEEINDFAVSMGDAFESAFEKAVFGAEKFHDVLGGLLIDLGKMVLRQQVTGPLSNAIQNLSGGPGTSLLGQAWPIFLSSKNYEGFKNIQTVGPAPAAATDTGPAAAGILEQILGGFFKMFSFRAEGGPISPNRPYVVGEKGPEIIVPRAPGMVIPNGSLRSSGGSVTVNQSITYGADDRTGALALAAVVKADTIRAIRESRERGAWQ